MTRRAWWESGSIRREGGRLRLGRRSAESWARDLGTPLFVYSRARILENYRRLESVFAAAGDLEVRICYAMKANPYRPILEALRGADSWIDAVSPREAKEALRAGFPSARILFTGTSLGAEDIRAVFGLGGILVNIDAVEQVAIMKDARPRGGAGNPPRVSVRWNPGIGSGFNSKVITAGERSSDGTPIKFGVEESRVLEAFESAAAAGFRPVGLHQHLGSGWTGRDYPTVLQAVDRMIDMAGKIVRAGFRLEFLDFGGGFGPRYSRDQSLFPLERYARALVSRVRRARLGIRALAVEPGKFLVADAGVLLVRVNYLKTSYGNRFACVDAGTFNSLPRTAVYGRAFHEIVNASRAGGPRAPVTVAGNLCETGDVFGKDIPMTTPRPGEILAVLGAGAYGRSMASEFNLRPLAREVLF